MSANKQKCRLSKKKSTYQHWKYNKIENRLASVILKFWYYNVLNVIKVQTNMKLVLKKNFNKWIQDKYVIKQKKL